MAGDPEGCQEIKTDLIEHLSKIVEQFDDVQVWSLPNVDFGPGIGNMLIVKFEIWPMLNKPAPGFEHVRDMSDDALPPNTCHECRGKGHVRSSKPPYERYYCHQCNGKGEIS